MILRVVAYYLMFILLGFGRSSFGPTFPALAEQVGVTVVLIGWLNLTRAAGALLSARISGIFYERLPGNLVASTAIALIGALFFAVSFSQSFWLLGILFFLTGFCESFLDVGGNTLLLWSAKSDKQATSLISGLHFFFGFGGFLVPLVLAFFFANAFGAPTIYRALALPFFLLAIFIALQPNPERRKTKNEAKVDAHTGTLTLTARQVRLVTLVSIGMFFLYTSMEITYGAWIYTYALRMTSATEVTAAYFASGFWGAVTLGRLAAAMAGRRVAPRVLLALGIVMSLLSILIAVFFTTVPFLWIATLGFGFFVGPTFPLLLSYLDRTIHLTPALMGWIYTAGAVGALLVPSAMGTLLGLNPTWLMLGVLGLMILQAIAFVMLTRTA